MELSIPALAVLLDQLNQQLNMPKNGISFNNKPFKKKKLGRLFNAAGRVVFRLFLNLL